jgi:fructokinase
MYLVCGEALYDFFLTDSTTPGALTFDARAAGSPFNTAIGIVRQGGKSALFTGVSTDMLGRRLVEVLEAEGVATRYLVRSDRLTTLSLVDLSAGQPAYAFYGAGAADRSLTEADLPALGDEITGLHFGSYSIAAEPIATTLAALAERERHRFISLDPNIRPTVVPSPDIWRQRIEELLPVADLVKISTEDLEIVYPGATAETIAADWLGRGPTLIVVTDGGKPVRAFRGADCMSVTPPDVEIVDTVGAGDAFQATLLARLAELGGPANAIQTVGNTELGGILLDAASVAAANCARRGFDIPRRVNWSTISC